MEPLLKWLIKGLVKEREDIETQVRLPTKQHKQAKKQCHA